MDTDASKSIIHDPQVHIEKFNNKKISANMWSTMTRPFAMSYEAKVGLYFLNLMLWHTFLRHFMSLTKNNYIIFLADTSIEN